MFKKSKSSKREDEFMPKPETSDFSPTPTSEPANAKTVIGEHISIKGDIRGHENLVIEGSMQGKIELEENQITIGPKGRVQAEINAKNVFISGQLKGNIQALGMVKITRDANFNGEIKARSISVEDGAYLKAAIELQRDPKKADPAMEKTTSKPTQDTAGSSANQLLKKSHLGSRIQ
jgi:cytoskeletal protein CcmA (bactofilin family)